jgi:hypothetical protein
MEETKKPGAPTKFDVDYPRMAEVACAEGGFTDKKLALLFDVAKSTINEWKKDHPEFKEALKKGKDFFDTEVVEKAFLKRCTGFAYNETTHEPQITKVLKGDGTQEEIYKMVVTKRVRKFVVPSARGCMDWLTNRAPDRWKKSKHVEITGKDGGPVQTDSMVAVPSGPMSIEQWEKEVREARKHDKELDPTYVPGNA